MHVQLTPGAEYIDGFGRVWRVDKTASLVPTDSFVFRPKKAPQSAFGGPPASAPPPPEPDPLQKATGWVEAYVPGGWWLVAGVGAFVAWQLLIPPPPKAKQRRPVAPTKAAPTPKRS